MTDRPMDDTEAPGEHPDEGLIHAWLDEALDAAESERLAAHVRECPVCQERVAEARGLIAGASRIVSALDDVPLGTRSGWAQNAVSGAASTSAGEPVANPALPQRSLWRWLRVTPGRAALAATILIALGITLTHDRVAEDTSRPMASVFNPQRADAPALDSSREDAGGAGLAKSEVAAPRDALLDSAVARNVQIAQGKRVLKAAPGQPLPQAPPVPSPTAPVALDGRAVAEGRAESQARRELSSAVAADRARVGTSRDEREAVAVVASPAPNRRDITGATASVGVADMAQQVGNAVAKTCWRLENADPGASWGDQPFPMILVVDAGEAGAPRAVSVLTSSGAPTSVRGSWNARGSDSVSIGLRRIGYSGSIVLGPGDALRTGIAVSGPVGTQLEQVVVTGYGTEQARSRADGGRAAESRKAAPSAAAAPARDQAAAATPQSGPPLRQVRITARPVSCPAG